MMATMTAAGMAAEMMRMTITLAPAAGNDSDD
jgi:hypothetical protein